MFIMAHLEADESSENNKILILHFISVGLSPLTWNLWCWGLEIFQYSDWFEGLSSEPLVMYETLCPLSVGFYQTLLKHKKHSTLFIFWPWIVKYLLSSCCLALWQFSVSVNQNKFTSTSNICHSKSFVEISAIFVNCFNTRFKHLFESQYWPI